ncbi:uncharacterized protein LOC119426248 [Nematolebias whitei]|uniref:uncharacterized protein LOC119426248 n=1 Tax=Nematolebias whitei TaxID=451745 RepID=UPI001899550F|nr:uncharacterized protein LOC119426248 [Nematolebias whitei]
MAAAIGILLRVLLFCLLAARGFQATAASAGSAEITESEDVLDADSTSDSTSTDAIDESSWAPEDSIFEPNETSSHHFKGRELQETEPLQHNKSRHHNLSSDFQEELPDKSGKSRKCLFREPNQPPCEAEGPREVICSTLETFCKPQDSETLAGQHHLYSQMSQLLRLLKQINYRPEEEPPHGALPKWLQEHKRDRYVPKRLFGPQQHGFLPKHHDYAPHKHQSSRVPHYYDSKPQPYDLQIPESYSQGHLSREFREPHSYLPHSRHHEYLPQDFQRRIPHEKPSFKPQVHRMPRYMARWTDFLPQRPHYLAMRPRLSANRLQYRQPANMPQMFYYASK